MYTRGLICVIIVLGIGQIRAQETVTYNQMYYYNKPVRWGFGLGPNFLYYSMEQSQNAKNNNLNVGQANAGFGLHVHLISNIQLRNQLDLSLMAGFLFGERTIFLKDNTGELNYDKRITDVEAAYFEFPILFKYRSARDFNFGAYMLSGFNIKYNIATRNQYTMQTPMLLVHPIDIYMVFGGGVSFFRKEVKLSTELKFEFGLRDILKSTHFTSNPADGFIEYNTQMIKAAFSRIIVLSLLIE